MKSLAFKAALLALVSLGLTWSASSMAIEEPGFELVRTDGNNELRQYRPFIVAEVTVDGDMDTASSRGFRLIADYIFGNNRSVRADTGKPSEKIEMTAPVTVEPVTGASEKINMTAPVTIEPQGGDKPAMGSAQRWRVHFVMPSAYTMATLPRPNNPQVSLREVAGKRVAVRRFSGFSGNDKVEREAAALRQWIGEQNLKAGGALQLSRYDPPWKLPFLRRNEVMIEVSD